MLEPPCNAILWFPFTIWTTYAMCALRYIENLFAHIPHKKHPRWFKISINAGFFAVHAASHPHTLLDRIESLLIPIWHFMQRDVNRYRGRRGVDVKSITALLRDNYQAKLSNAPLYRKIPFSIGTCMYSTVYFMDYLWHFVCLSLLDSNLTVFAVRILRAADETNKKF